ncbi:MAG TPA: BON domain-containing protein [Bryobacteraceae bacterium]
MSNKRIASMLSGALMAASLSIGPLQAMQDSTAKPPDNTRMNKRDKSQSERTADQAKNNPSDRQIMARIRRDVTKDKTLSTYAHNVKIIAEHGKVTLKGPVRSDDEKRTIEEYARKYAGDGNVTNELDIKAENK